MATQSERPLAVVTGASSGIGAELAACAASAGFDLIIAADEPEIQSMAERFSKQGASVEAVQSDLSTTEGVDKLLEATHGRPIDALLANAGRGMGHAFLDQSFDDVKLVIDTNVTGTVYLLHKVASQMRSRGKGRILITGSIAGFMPGTFQAIYNATKAFLDSFSLALRAELKDSGVTVTCLMPGATDTEFFARAGMLDTSVGSGKKQPASEVAQSGFDAMMKGDSEVVTGWQNKLRAAFSHIAPSELLAEVHRMMAKPQGAAKS